MHRAPAPLPLKSRNQSLLAFAVMMHLQMQPAPTDDLGTDTPTHSSIAAPCQHLQSTHLSLLGTTTGLNTASKPVQLFVFVAGSLAATAGL